MKRKLEIVDLVSDSESDQDNDSESRNVKKHNLDDKSKIQCINLRNSEYSGIESGKSTPFYLLQLSTERAKNTLSIRDIIDSTDGNILKICLMNYMIDMEWLLSECPILLSVPCLVVHGSDIDKSICSMCPMLKCCEVDLRNERYGTHHSKIAMIVYDTGIRIAIFTANFIELDFRYLTNSVYIQDFPRIGSSQNLLETEFSNYLMMYLRAIHVKQNKSSLDQFIASLAEFDFSTALVALVASIPGRFSGKEMSSWGHKRVQKLLMDNFTPVELSSTQSDHLFLQCSSLGSMGKEEKYLDELVKSFGCLIQSEKKCVELIWPTVDCVRDSVLGYTSGSSLPCSVKTLYNNMDNSCPFPEKKSTNNQLKNGFRRVFCHYDGSPLFRQHNMAHMKCYGQYRSAVHLPDQCSSCIDIKWLLITSSNVSQAAWGVLEKQESQLYMKSYEIGVFFNPKEYGRRVQCYSPFSCTPCHPILGIEALQRLKRSLCGISDCSFRVGYDEKGLWTSTTTGNINSNNDPDKSIDVPVPFRLPPKRYDFDQDIPWMWDVAYQYPDQFNVYR